MVNAVEGEERREKEIAIGEKEDCFWRCRGGFRNCIKFSDNLCFPFDFFELLREREEEEEERVIGCERVCWEGKSGQG